jgi:hypothetical protein
MKPILRDLRTGLYFQGGATWTANPEDALVYADIENALEAAQSSRMTSLELNILFFEDPQYTVRLALHEFFGGQTVESDLSINDLGHPTHRLIV